MWFLVLISVLLCRLMGLICWMGINLSLKKKKKTTTFKPALQLQYLHPRLLCLRWNISRMLTRPIAAGDYYSVRFAACFALEEFHPKLLGVPSKPEKCRHQRDWTLWKKKVCSLSPYPYFWSWIKDGRLKKKTPGLHNLCWHFNGDIFERICDGENTPVLSECQHIVTGKPLAVGRHSYWHLTSVTRGFPPPSDLMLVINAASGVHLQRAIRWSCWRARASRGPRLDLHTYPSK